MHQIALRISHKELIELAKNGDLRAQYLVIRNHEAAIQGKLFPHQSSLYIEFFNQLNIEQTSRGISIKQQLPILYKTKENQNIEKENHALFQAMVDEIYLDIVRKRDGYGSKERHMDYVLKFSLNEERIPMKNESRYKYFMSKKVKAIQKRWAHIFKFDDLKDI